MKKFLTCVLVTLMVLTLSGVVFAAEIDEGSADPSGSTEVTYTVEPTYTVTIPASVTLGNSMTVSVSDVVVPKGRQVVVRLTGTGEDDGAFRLRTSDGAVLAYRVKLLDDASAPRDIPLNGTLLAVKPEVGSGSATVTFVLDDTVTYAGRYFGTVIFTVSVEAQTP